MRQSRQSVLLSEEVIFNQTLESNKGAGCLGEERSRQKEEVRLEMGGGTTLHTAVKSLC